MADLLSREALDQLSYPVALQRLDLAGITVVSQQRARDNSIGYDVTLTRRSDAKSATAVDRPDVKEALMAAYDLLVESDASQSDPSSTPPTGSAAAPAVPPTPAVDPASTTSADSADVTTSPLPAPDEPPA